MPNFYYDTHYKKGTFFYVDLPVHTLQYETLDDFHLNGS